MKSTRRDVLRPIDWLVRGAKADRQKAGMIRLPYSPQQLLVPGDWNLELGYLAWCFHVDRSTHQFAVLDYEDDSLERATHERTQSAPFAAAGHAERPGRLLRAAACDLTLHGENQYANTAPDYLPVRKRRH